MKNRRKQYPGYVEGTTHRPGQVFSPRRKVLCKLGRKVRYSLFSFFSAVGFRRTVSQVKAKSVSDREKKKKRRKDWEVQWDRHKFFLYWLN